MCNVTSGNQVPKSPISCNTISIRLIMVLLFIDIGSVGDTMFPYKIRLPLFLLLLLLLMMIIIIIVQFY